MDPLNHWAPLSFVNKTILSTVRLVYVFGNKSSSGSEALLITNDDEVLATGMNIRFSHGGVNGIFVVAYTETGCVYQWGEEIGKEIPMDVCIPQLVYIPRKIAAVACGSQHCLALGMDGEVFSWGSNEFGQLGKQTSKRSDVPLLVEGVLGARITNISCGYQFSIALDDNGRVYAWGRNNSCQLGFNTYSFIEKSTPTRLIALKDVKVKDVACGMEHVLAVTNDGELFVWGRNLECALGLGDTENRTIPEKNKRVAKIVDIAASSQCSTSAVMTENSEVLVCGSVFGNLKFQLFTKMQYESLHDVFANVTVPRITYKPIVRHLQWEPINVSLERAFQDKETSDLIIKAEGKEIFVHRTILRLRSNYYRLFLQDHWVGSDQKVVNVDRKYDVILAYLQYLYTGQLKADPLLALELLSLAEEFQDLAVKKYCVEKIKNGICKDNVASLFPMALRLNSVELQKSCILFAVNHINEVVLTPTFSEWDKDTMKEFILQCQKSELFRTNRVQL